VAGLTSFAQARPDVLAAQLWAAGQAARNASPPPARFAAAAPCPSFPLTTRRWPPIFPFFSPPEQVLRAFKVPCDPLRLKEAYRTAVRMYHPDSNSKEKVWRTEEQREQAEEVMKVINERKPDSL
jgi:hypothetical protein